MHDWYYSVDRQPASGPLALAELRRQLAEGSLPATTLVWREGMAQWQRADHPELGLFAPLPGPPALPPSPPAATPAPATTARQPSPPVLGRGLLWLLVGLCAVVMLVVVLAIVAAIALPAYQNYVRVSRAATVLAALRPLQHGVETSLASAGRCPDSSSAALLQPLAVARAADNIAGIELVTAANGHCGIAVQLDGLQRDDTKRPARLWLEHTGHGDWICRSTLRDSQLPRLCRRSQQD